MSKSNMFAALASDSDDEYHAVTNKKTENKDKTTKTHKDESNEVVGTRRVEEGEFNEGPKKTRASRGRGRGRGDRGRGGYGFEGEVRGGRGGYRGRGDRGRGDRGRGYRGRGERGSGYGGRGRGYGGRGGRVDGPRDQYSKLASREEVTGHGEEPQEHQETQEYGRDRYYEKRSGTGYGHEVKKGGAGKGGWGAPEQDSKLEHLEADTAVETANAEGEENKEKPAEEVHVEEPEKVEEEEEVNNLTYSEYMAEKKATQTALKKGVARKPEELNVKNIQSYEKTNYGAKGFKSASTHKSAAARTGLSGDVEFGFQPVGEEPEETYERSDRGDRGGRGRGGRGRGRGGHRGGRGDHRGASHGDHYQPKRSHQKKFAANEDDFPSL